MFDCPNILWSADLVEAGKIRLTDLSGESRVLDIETAEKIAWLAASWKDADTEEYLSLLEGTPSGYIISYVYPHGEESLTWRSTQDFWDAINLRYDLHSTGRHNVRLLIVPEGESVPDWAHQHVV
jgi:hypothetical protein